MAGLVFFLLGAAWIGTFVAIHQRAAAQAAAAASWPWTNARIVAAQVRGSRSSKGGSWYCPAVEYEYAVGGRSYRGTRIRFGNMYSQTEAPAEELVRRYAPGTTGPVRYNPEDPSQAVLETGEVSKRYLYMASLGLLFILFSLLAFARGV